MKNLLKQQHSIYSMHTQRSGSHSPSHGCSREDHASAHQSQQWLGEGTHASPSHWQEWDHAFHGPNQGVAHNFIPLPGSSTRLQCLLLRDSTDSMQLEGPAGHALWSIFPKTFFTHPGLSYWVSRSQHLWTIKSDNVINVFVQLLSLLSAIAPFFPVLLLAVHFQDQLFNSEGQSWVATVTVLYVSSTEHNHCQLLFPSSLSFYNCPSAYAQRCLVLCWLTWDEEKNTSVNQQTDFCGSHLYSYCWPLLWSLPADYLWGDFMGEGVGIQLLITVLNSNSWPCSYCRCSFKTHLLHWFLNSVFNLNI